MRLLFLYRARAVKADTLRLACNADALYGNGAHHGLLRKQV